MATTKWSADNMHSEIGFKVKHMMITNVSGTFDKYTIHSETESDNFENAKINFSADVNSLKTGVSDRDGHLMSDDFFNAEKFPTINFTSTNLKKKGDGEFELAGDLTIRDVTKPVQLNVEYAGIVKDGYGQTKAGFIVTGKIKRSDFNLKWNAVTEAGSIVVSDEVRISCEIQLTKQA